MSSAIRSVNTAQDDDYFPSFLTALQSGPKTDKSKESAPRSRSEVHLLSLNGKERLTFAESLSMNQKKRHDVEMPKASPFSLSSNYQDGLGTRRRKNASCQDGEHNSDAYIEDAVPPPKMSLSNPSSLSIGSQCLDDDKASVSTSAHHNVATWPSSYPLTHSNEWGQDNQYWVTVFGFPSSAKSYILHQFQAVGEVVNYSSSNSGNWLHLRYCTRLQAEKALGYDGRTLINNIMVGVKKCYSYDRKEDAFVETPVSNYFGAGARQSLGSRSLEVDPTDTDILLPPKRRQDICSRLLSYLFNW